MSVQSIKESTRSLFGIGAIPRLVNVLINCIIVQLAPLEWYGLHNVNLVFFVTITEWLRTQCFRRIMLRSSTSQMSANTDRVNLCRLSFYCTLPLICGMAALYILKPPALVAIQTQKEYEKCYRICVILHGGAALLNSATDLIYYELCESGNHGARLFADTTCALAYSLTTAAVLFVARCLSSNMGCAVLLASGLAQLVWSILFVYMCTKGARRNLKWMRIQLCNQIALPYMHLNEENEFRYLSPEVRDQVKVELFQSVQKWVVSEADKLLMMRYFDDVTKGAISLVSNLGGFALRLFFQPQEEMLFIHYSSVGLQPEMDCARLYEYFSALRIISLAQWSVGLAAALFGPLFARATLLFLYGSEIAVHHELLGRYAGIIFLYGVNGILECMISSSGTPLWQWRHIFSSRVGWIIGTVTAVIFWECKSNALANTSIWFLCIILSLLGRILIPLQFLLHIVRGISSTEKVHVFFHPNIKNVLTIYIITYSSVRLLLRSQLWQMLDNLIAFLPASQQYRGRVLLSQLLLGAGVAAVVRVTIVKALATASKMTNTSKCTAARDNTPKRYD